MDFDNLLVQVSDIGFIAEAHRWIVQVFIVVFATLVLSWLVKHILNRLEQHFERSRIIWDSNLIVAGRRPVGFLIWIMGLLWAGEIAYQQADIELVIAFDPIRRVAVIILLSWFLIRFIGRIQLAMIRPERVKPVDQTTASAIGKLLRASVFITATLVILQTLGFSVSGVLAFGGIGGIAVGFAARDLLANFFGGLMIYLDRPFSVGDWIRSPDQEIEGVVEEIGWRQSRIRTFDLRPLYVPNSVFANISVENPSRMHHRRIYETIGMRYEDAERLPVIIDEVKKMLTNHSEIAQDQTMIVNFNRYGASSLDFFVYVFTNTTNWIRYHEIKQEILLKIYEIIRAQGADIAFPTSTLHVPEPVKLQQEQGT